MIGASSTWYATSARLRTSRSSAARAAGLEDAKKLLCPVDDHVRLLSLEPRAVVDATPRHRHGEHPRRLRGADVERRVPDVGRLHGIGAEPLGSEQQRLGIRLVPLGLVAADDRLEQMAERDIRKASSTVSRRFAETTPSRR